MNILVCEDEPMMNKVLTSKLTSDGHIVTSVFDGKEASKYILNNEPELIITDLLMPFVTGLELVNLVRKDLKRDTPIIVLSKIGLEETVLEAFELGADDYITKPFSPQELSIRIKKIMLRFR